MSEVLQMMRLTYNRLVHATENHGGRCECGLCEARRVTAQRISKEEEELKEYVERRTTNSGQGGGV
jgi:hypothetical protein